MFANSAGSPAPDGPLVTALVSTYAAARLMPSLLADLEAQTLADQLEIVVIDSCSPENEGEIVRAFQQQYSNIVYLRTEQRENVHIALNRGIRLARGKYLALANTDDRHVPEAYARMVAQLEARPEIALVYADIALTQNEADLTHHRPLHQAEILALYQWPEFNPVSFFQQGYAGPQPMWRRSLHAQYGDFDPEFPFAGDFEFWLRLIAKGEKFAHLPAVLGLMLHSAASVSNSHFKALWAEAMRCRQRYWPPHLGPCPAPLQAHAYAALPQPQFRNQPGVLRTPDLVSVLVRVAHPEQLLESLATVLGQNQAPLELLILNASGTDLGPLLAQIPDLPSTLILNPGKLPATLARNLCLRLAQGKFLCFLSSGERWHSQHLALHLQALQSHDFVYSEAWRLPYRQANSFVERINRDRNNTADLSQGSLLGQFKASLACSYRTRRLLELTFDGERLESPDAPACWQALQALQQSAFFGAQTLRYPDWDLQWLALEQLTVKRLDTLTCEYFDESAALPDGKPLCQRILDSVSQLAAPAAPPAKADLALILFAREHLEWVLNCLNGQPPKQTIQLLLLSRDFVPVQTGSPFPQLSIRCLQLLNAQTATEQLSHALALSHAKVMAMVRNPEALEKLFALTDDEGFSALQNQTWKQITVDAVLDEWVQSQAMHAQTSDWWKFLEGRKSQVPQKEIC